MGLGFLLTLALLSNGQSNCSLVEIDTSLCYETCPPGYHVTADCDRQLPSYRCKKCDNGHFTDINNTLWDGCLRCDVCLNKEVETQKCTYNSNTKCDCPNGYYYLGDRSHGDCNLCPSTPCEDNKLDCKRKCQSNITNTTSRIQTTTPINSSTGMTSTTTGVTPSINPTIYPSSGPKFHWTGLFFIVSLAFLVLFWLIVVCNHSYSANKDLQLPVEDPGDKEQPSLQGSSPTTVTLHIREETTEMALSQSSAPQEHPPPTHRSHLLSDTEHRADRQVEQSGQWPAIVLYTIIREVPLRRWKEFLRLLSVTDQEMERVELEAGLGRDSWEMQYQMLRLWSQRPSARLNDIFSVLRDMGLTRCAMILQENLDKLEV